jgi:pimeloyl-ACP methyl ester carboxylesterase
VPERNATLREFWFNKLQGANPGFMHGTARAMAEEHDRSAELAATGLPVLVVHGKRDKRVWSRAAFAAMAAQLGADHVVIDKAAHSPSLEQPQQTVEVLLNFWARHPAEGFMPAPAASEVRA